MGSRYHLVEFVERVCAEMIGMRRFGEPLIEWFGSAEDGTDGYSLVQLIEGSSIVGHFSKSRGEVYLNVFSCRPLDPGSLETFSKGFFGGLESLLVCLERG